MACPFSGYTIKFDIYTGKRGNATHHGLAYDVIFDLLDGYLSKGHIVFMDRFYSSLQLYLDLFQLGTGAVGTIMTTRKGYPKNLNNEITKRSQRGLIRWFRKDNAVFVAWKDRQVVNLISTVHSGSDNVQCSRKVSTDGRWSLVNIPQPLVVKEYNQYMGGVDLSDKLISYYSVRQKTLKYYKTLFFHLIDIAVTNCFILHKLHAKYLGIQYMDHRNFNKALAQQLLELYDGPGSSSSAQFSNPNVAHLPVPLERAPCNSSHRFQRGQCRQCSSKNIEQKTMWQCQSCLVPLCLQPDRNCFLDFHAPK